MKTTFFDVTDIIRYVKTETSISGIQRVTLEIIRRMLDRDGANRVRLCHWEAHTGRYLVQDAGFLADMQEFDADVLGAAFFGGRSRPARSVVPMLARYRNQPLKYRFHHTVAHVQALRGNTTYFQSRGSSLADWRAARTAAPRAAAALPPQGERTPIEAVIAPGDSIVLLGAGWGIAGLDACLQRLVQDRGARVSMMVHDLIPLITPAHVPGGMALEFYRWLAQSAGYCRRYLANSEHTARDLRAFMAETGTQRPIDVIPLAQQAVRPPATEEVSQTGPLRARALRQHTLDPALVALTRDPYVLVVGTMETRKNLWRLAQAWARLAQDRNIELPRLVLAGKRSPQNADFNTWMERSGNLDGWVQFADRPSDDALSYLYENCIFTATVSLYEGWGLPIGESLAFGKTAVVADNSSMPEVGGDMVEYCDAHSIDSIHAACHKLITDPAHREALEARIKAADLRSWDDVAADFVAALETPQP
jgi:glycosyltransferase involved in cell wall biosynthesis